MMTLRHLPLPIAGAPPLSPMRRVPLDLPAEAETLAPDALARLPMPWETEPWDLPILYMMVFLVLGCCEVPAQRKRPLKDA